MALHIDELLTTQEAAKILKVKPNTLAKWRVIGAGPLFVTMGRAVRYRLSDLKIFIERNARQSTSQT